MVSGLADGASGTREEEIGAEVEDGQQGERPGGPPKPSAQCTACLSHNPSGTILFGSSAVVPVRGADPKLCARRVSGGLSARRGFPRCAFSEAMRLY